jgi:hypothetical protein
LKHVPLLFPTKSNDDNNVAWFAINAQYMRRFQNEGKTIKIINGAFRVRQRG